VKHIKTRIKHNTKAGKAAKKIGGFSVAELQRALTGDTAALKKLGEVYREGEMASVVMPSIIKTIQAKVKNEKDWNQFLGQYVKDGSEAAIAIDKATNQASLANAKYMHGRKELTEQFKAAWEMEKGRHKFAINYNRAKLFADLVFQKVDGVVALKEQGSRIKLRQIDENKKYEIESSQHLLEYGADANLDLIQKRDYSTKTGIRHRVTRSIRNLIGI
jgi:hypothetical protein